MGNPKAQINSTRMNIDNRDFLLVDISRSPGTIGVTAFEIHTASPFEKPAVTEFLYADNEVLLNLTTPPKGDEFTEKLVAQVSTLTLCEEDTKNVLAYACESYFTHSHSMSKSLQPLFEILADGTYICHEAKMIPGDGSGKFFWNAFTSRSVVEGTAKHNRHMDTDSNYTPCFLLPTVSSAEFSETKFKAQHDKLTAGKKIGGLAFFMSGMFSALLEGHHTASACLANDMDFRCIVIEPLNEVLYETDEIAAEHGREPKIIAISCPFVKIPVEEIPATMLESFLLRRSGIKPYKFAELKKKSRRTLKAMNKRVIPREILQKAELLPNFPMVISASRVSGLSDEQLDALIAGETALDDKVIIGSSHHNSVVTACDFLQYEDFERFFKFAESILRNPELVSSHTHIIERLCNINDKRVHELFSSLLESEAEVYQNYADTFSNYNADYSKFLNEIQPAKAPPKKKLPNIVGLLGGEISDSNLALMDNYSKRRT